MEAPAPALTLQSAKRIRTTRAYQP
eukprot:COSAG06_NODE_61651_length_267_cov_0.613095_1_plen_24_part_10